MINYKEELRKLMFEIYDPRDAYDLDSKILGPLSSMSQFIVNNEEWKRIYDDFKEKNKDFFLKKKQDAINEL
jgi:hypothetical protein